MHWIKRVKYKNLLTNLLIMVSSFVFISIVLEGVIRLKHALHPSQQYFYMDEKLGWKVPKNYHFEGYQKDAQNVEYFVKFDTNQYGSRVFGDINSKKKKVLVIGDSFTDAINVSNDKTYYGILQKELPIEVFACGSGGYGTLQEYMILDEFIDMVKPDILLLQYCTNDFIDNSYDLECDSLVNNAGKRRPYLTKDGQIFYAIPKRFTCIRELSKYSDLLYFVLSRMDRIRASTGTEGKTVEYYIEAEGKNHKGFKDSVEITNEIMKKIRFRASNCKILAFCVNYTQPYYDEFALLSKINNIVFIDGIPQAIIESDKKGYNTRIADKSHWNELGHKIAAEKIKEYLNKSGILNN